MNDAIKLSENREKYEQREGERERENCHNITETLVSFLTVVFLLSLSPYIVFFKLYPHVSDE